MKLQFPKRQRTMTHRPIRWPHSNDGIERGFVQGVEVIVTVTPDDAGRSITYKELDDYFESSLGYDYVLARTLGRTVITPSGKNQYKLELLPGKILPKINRVLPNLIRWKNIMETWPEPVDNPATAFLHGVISFFVAVPAAGLGRFIYDMWWKLQ